MPAILAGRSLIQQLTSYIDIGGHNIDQRPDRSPKFERGVVMDCHRSLRLCIVYSTGVTKCLRFTRSLCVQQLAGKFLFALRVFKTFILHGRIHGIARQTEISMPNLSDTFARRRRYRVSSGIHVHVSFNNDTICYPVCITHAGLLVCVLSLSLSGDINRSRACNGLPLCSRCRTPVGCRGQIS